MAPVRHLARAVSPWAPHETWMALAPVAAGFVVVGLAWSSLAGVAAWDDQLGRVGFAIGGFALGAFGAVSWLLRARTRLVDRRRSLLTELTVAPAAAAVAATGAIVADPDQGRFHLASCQLARGKVWAAVSRDAMERAGRRPCGMCQP